MFGFKLNFPRKTQLIKALKRPKKLPELRYPDSGVMAFRRKRKPFSLTVNQIRFLSLAISILFWCWIFGVFG